MRLPHPVVAHEEQGADALTDADRARMMAGVSKQIREFLESPAASAMSKDWREAAGFVCETLHRAKMDDMDGRPDGLAPRHVSRYMLDYFPRKVSADAPTARRVPEILDRYFEWLGSKGLASEADAARLRARVERLRDDFLSIAADPANFGPAKSVVLAMHAAGVDFSNPAAVESFIVKHNEDLAGGGARKVARGRPPARGAGQRRGRSKTPHR